MAQPDDWLAGKKLVAGPPLVAWASADIGGQMVRLLAAKVADTTVPAQWVGEGPGLSPLEVEGDDLLRQENEQHHLALAVVAAVVAVDTTAVGGTVGVAVGIADGVGARG